MTDRNKITIKQMLQQSSGIDYPSILNKPFDRVEPTGGWRSHRRSDAQSAAKKKPNSEFAYNGINPQALGILLQRATGQKYSTYLAE